VRTTPRRPLLELAGIAATIFCVWLMIAVFNVSEFYRRSAAVYSHMIVADLLEYQFMVSINWMFFTPFIVFLAERVPVRGPNRRRNFAILLVVAPLIALIRAAFGGVILKLYEGVPVKLSFIELSVLLRIHRYLFVVVVIVGLTHFIETYRQAVARERQAFLLEAELANAELAQLRARLQPRFMFSTLHMIAERIRTAPAEADRLLVSLSDLLRRSLDFDRRGEVTLREELEFVDSYLSIERTRLGDALRSRIDADDHLLKARVPSLLLQTLVESAVVEAGEEGKIDIDVTADGDVLQLRVRSRARQGVGEVTLHDVQARLETFFGRSDTVTVDRGAAVVVVTVRFPLQFQVAA
jgi:signal transduction histidine kinase